jgi:hypothetical protein
MAGIRAFSKAGYFINKGRVYWRSIENNRVSSLLMLFSLNKKVKKQNKCERKTMPCKPISIWLAGHCFNDS